MNVDLPVPGPPFIMYMRESVRGEKISENRLRKPASVLAAAKYFLFIVSSFFAVFRIFYRLHGEISVFFHRHSMHARGKTIIKSRKTFSREAIAIHFFALLPPSCVFIGNILNFFVLALDIRKQIVYNGKREF